MFGVIDNWKFISENGQVYYFYALDKVVLDTYRVVLESRWILVWSMSSNDGMRYSTIKDDFSIDDKFLPKDLKIFVKKLFKMKAFT